MIIRPGRQGRRAGLGTTRATEYGSLARGSSFSPLQQPVNLVGWFRADKGITLGDTPLASGTAPPVVTLSGTLVQSLGLYIQIDGAGVLGVATFKWSVDNGVSFVATAVLTGASVALGTTGITAAFTVGAYLTNNIYKATVASWADQSAAGNALTQATAGQQPLFTTSGRNNKPAITVENTRVCWLNRANANLFGAGAYTIIQVVQSGQTSAQVSFGNTNAAGSAGVYTGPGANRVVTHPGAFGATGGTATTNYEIWSLRRAAASAPTLRINRVSQALAGAGAGLVDPGGAAVLHLGASAAGASQWLGVFSEAILYNAAISDALLVQNEFYLSDRYAF